MLSADKWWESRESVFWTVDYAKPLRRVRNFVAIATTWLLLACWSGQPETWNNAVEPVSAESPLLENPFATVESWSQNSPESQHFRDANLEELITKKCQPNWEPLMARTQWMSPNGTFYGDTVCPVDNPQES